MKSFYLVLYYSIARFLPSSSACKFCVKLRGFIVSRIFTCVGNNVNIAQGVIFGRGTKISIGDNSGIGENSRLVCMDEISIGDNVMIAPEVMILTGGHGYEDRDLLLREQRIIVAPVIIGDDCWIGSRAILLPGVTICDRVIVAAGSVVTKPIYESGVYGGNPARKIKDLP